ncbi:MAG: FHA domain-containing protein [Planctomycetota bacterium]
MNLYHLLLSIPPGDRPPTHYQLLGLAPFEANEEVIEIAHRRQCRHVRAHALRFPDETQRLLNELTEAKVCLCDPARRREYEQQTRDGFDDGPGDANASAMAISDSSMPRSARLHELEDAITSDSLSAPSWDLPSVAAESTRLNGDSEWIVGSGPDCPIRVRAPWVSRRHCRIRVVDRTARIEDLGSTNGTYVNGRQVDGEVRVGEGDVVTLGKKTRLPWPLPSDCTGADLEVFSIGRSPECDYVIDDKSVSSLHAQLIVEGEVVLLEDLKSTNGTRVGRLSNRIDRCEIEPHLSLFFGAKKVFAKTLLDAVQQQRYG